MTRILQITDTHIVCPPLKVSGVLDTLSLFENAIAKIEQDLAKLGKVDAILVTGDISDNGDLDSYLAFKSVISRLGIPYFVLPGNHDLRASMHQCFDDLSPAISEEINWIKTFPDLDIIGLDTVIPGQSGGKLSSSGLTFLAQALQRHPEKPALIAMHHPPFESGIRFIDAIGLEGAQEMAEILEQSARDIRIICGHLHNSIVSTIGGATVLSSPATASCFLTDHRQDAPVGFTQDHGGYMLHEWNQGFRSTYLSLAPHGAVQPF